MNPRTVSVPQIPVLVCRSCFCSLIVPFLPVFYPASYLALETQGHLSAVLPVDLLRPYGSVFPFALAERSWVWILLELSPHVGGLRKKTQKKPVFSGDRGPAMTASFSRLCPLETRWWAYTSRDWLSRWPFITASLNPSGTFVPYPEGIPWLRLDWWTRM